MRRSGPGRACGFLEEAMMNWLQQDIVFRLRVLLSQRVGVELNERFRGAAGCDPALSDTASTREDPWLWQR
eukprot:16443133-Heterocapsa_arctica.AAC.1